MFITRFITHLSVVCVLLALAIPLRAEEPDVLIADFEDTDYGEWRKTGEAFGPSPARGTLPNQMPVDGFEGDRLVNSYYGGDAPTGTLTSPEFEINRSYLRFLIGGGGWEGKTCMNLVIAGRTVRTATGTNINAGGSERLELAGWDVSDLRGRRAQLVIVDQATGGWGHINVDHIVLSDEKPPPILISPQREFVAEKQYLNFPVKNGAPRHVVTVKIGEQKLHRFDIELADQEPDWWAPLDIAAQQGQTLVVEVDRLQEQSQALANVRQSDGLLGAENLYNEPLRPMLHFSPRRGWTNDPNGLVFYQGEYHLFFQHNPYGTSWGNMHWGHAVSRDLLHWQEMGEALYPDDMGTMFSGCAVIDWNNTSGLQTGSEPPMILFYTAAGEPFVQCLAYSNDRGRTFTKYAQNPILKNITPGNRDPKVIWHEPTQQWIMVLYVEVEKIHTIQFFTSPNLKEWEFQSQTDGFFECPDFFPLALDGDTEKTKWVLTAASSQYMVGSFDGNKFLPETEKLPGHRGNAFYAAQTFADIPSEDGRRIQIGWGQMPAPAMPFNQIMCLPCELLLRSTSAGPRLAWQSVREFQEKLPASQTISIAEKRIPEGGLVIHANGEALDALIEFQIGDAQQVGMTIRGIEITCDVKSKELICLGRTAPVALEQQRLRLRAIVDRTSLEIFADDGLVYMPLAVVPAPDQKEITIFSRGGSASLQGGSVRVLRSIWAGH